MTDCIPGDIVRYGDGDRVVVDVTGDGLAVLRRREDIELREPVVEAAGSLEVVGHLDHLDGWVEDEPGQWRKS